MIRLRVAAPAVAAALAITAPAGAAAVLDEVVVTARKRTESLMEVPLSVAVISDAQIRELGITGNYGVADFTVNFSTLQQVGRELDRPVIRGMAAPPVRGEPNASYFIDGVFVSGSVSTATLDIVERVEVLRGPQSAQFGRATFAGAVNYITRQPGDEFEGRVAARAGTSDEYRLSGWFGGPLVPGHARFLVAAGKDHYGGQWHNALEPGSANPTFMWETPIDAGDTRRLGEERTLDLLARVNWELAEGSELRLKYSRTEGDDGHYATFLQRELNCFLPTDPSQPWFESTTGAFCGTHRIDGLFNRKNLPDFRGGVVTGTRTPQIPEGAVVLPAEPGAFRTSRRFLAEYLQDIGDWTLTFRGAYNREDFDNGFDLDHSEHRALLGLFNFFIEDRNRDFAFEARLASPADHPLRGQLGAYFYDFRGRARNRKFPGIGAILGDPYTGVLFTGRATNTVQNSAAFGALDWDFAPRWTLGVEARWARDEKSAQSPDGLGAVQKFDSFTPRITLRFAAADGLNFYLLAAKGNKPGDFNAEYFEGDKEPSAVTDAIASGDAFVKEEESWNYELGAKLAALDGRFAASAAVFLIDWTNQGIQALVPIPLKGNLPNFTTVIRNAGRSRVAGLELESALALTDRLTLNAAYGYVNAEFRRFNDPDYAAVTGIDDPDLVNGGNLAGFRIPNSPEHSLVLGAQYTLPLPAGLEWQLRGDSVLESDRMARADNFGRIGSRWLVNLRTGIGDDSWRLTAYVRNLLDDKTPLAVLNFFDFEVANVLDNGVNPTTNALNPQRRRDFGLEFRYDF